MTGWLARPGSEEGRQRECHIWKSFSTGQRPPTPAPECQWRRLSLVVGSSFLARAPIIPNNPNHKASGAARHAACIDRSGPAARDMRVRPSRPRGLGPGALACVQRETPDERLSRPQKTTTPKSTRVACIAWEEFHCIHRQPEAELSAVILVLYESRSFKFIHFDYATPIVSSSKPSTPIFWYFDIDC
uniref:Uncharacterized protein n=1 Tax=Panagrellus redivivus TaxID=6233 RepID=A0A7E4W0Z5_PANRE